jgi:hypothetical protein
MWCHQCREDVPALPSSEKPGLCCARCGEVIPPGSPTIDPASAYDGWELDEQLRHIDRMLQTTASKGIASGEIFRRESSRVDLPHPKSNAWHIPTIHPIPQQEAVKVEQVEQKTLLGILSWIALSFGTAGFTCGSILLGWSLATGRLELWSIGLPVAFGGQVALLIGLVLQLSRLWHDNRTAVVKLASTNEQLHAFKAAFTSSGCHRPSAATLASASVGNPDRPCDSSF